MAGVTIFKHDRRGFDDRQRNRERSRSGMSATGLLSSGRPDTIGWLRAVSLWRLAGSSDLETPQSREMLP